MSLDSNTRNALAEAHEICCCATPEVHAHPDGSHWCSWCSLALAGGSLRKTHKGGICACPPCPPHAHIRRRCR